MGEDLSQGPNQQPTDGEQAKPITVEGGSLPGTHIEVVQVDDEAQALPSEYNPNNPASATDMNPGQGSTDSEVGEVESNIGDVTEVVHDSPNDERNPKVSDTLPPGWVENKVLAHSMANAEDKDQTKRLNIEALAADSKTNDEIRDKFEDAIGKKLPSPAKYFARSDAKTERKELLRESDEFDSQYWKKTLETHSQMVKDFPNAGYEVRSHEERAKMYAERAARAAEWAAILHGNTNSERLRGEYEGIAIEPETMIIFEDRVEKKMKELERLNMMADSWKQNVFVHDYNTANEDDAELKSFFEQSDAETRTKIEHSEVVLNEALKDANRAKADLYRKVVVVPYHLEVLADKRLLDEVRAGRTTAE
jgi:hypothetical protein